MATIWNATEINNVKSRLNALETNSGGGGGSNQYPKIINNTAEDIARVGGMSELLNHPFLICIGGVPEGDLGYTRGYRLMSNYVDISKQYSNCGQISFLVGGTADNETCISVSFRQNNTDFTSNLLPYFQLIRDWANFMDGYQDSHVIERIVILG